METPVEELALLQESRIEQPARPLTSSRSRACAAAMALLAAAGAVRGSAKPYPLSPQGLCGATQTCAQVVDRWDQASWNALVDDTFNTGPAQLAAVRWYTTEYPCTGPLCNDQLNDGNGSCPVRSTTNSQFCGATDELSNVLLSLAMGTNQLHYEEVRNFVELLRHPAANGLQCWKFYVNGRKSYASYTDVCVTSDSAADASLRILGAYGIACAKQRARIWAISTVDYCADYLRQGDAILGIGTPSHGEVKVLANGNYFLANGYNNQPGSPTAAQSFRPDYYELQFLMDFANYTGNGALAQGVVEMLTAYSSAMGSSHVHRGKTGHFDADVTTYACDDLCAPAYMDSSDTWRAVPALSGLLNVHPDQVPSGLRTSIFDYWWQNYSGSVYGPKQVKPIEIYSDAGVKTVEDSYKTLGMWIPLSAAYDSSYTAAAVSHLVDDSYDTAGQRFWGAAYYGGYYSQFAQRAIGAATGMIDPDTWGAVSFYTATPCRVLDTRTSGQGPALSSGVARTIMIGGSCGIPTAAKAVSVNVTVTQPSQAGYLTFYPDQGPAPVASVISFAAGWTGASNTILSLDSSGQGTVQVFPSLVASGQVQLLVDVNGWFQ